MILISRTLQTNGRGYWSDVATGVTITKLTVPYINDEEDFGELRVYFDTKSWDVNTDGLIYTDRKFERDIRALLTQLGLAGGDVDYSEQGMQGNNYVSFDVGAKFIQSYNVTQLEQML